MHDYPSFSDFYRAINSNRDSDGNITERRPFPWQERLAERVGISGWPREIGVGTGMGKTSCLDIAVWAMAKEAYQEPSDRKMPTRIWYVVNRRMLVDAAWDHSLRIAQLLKDPNGGLDDDARNALKSVAEALRYRQGSAAIGDPLYVSRLRGAAELGARPLLVSQPAIITSTVHMYASRWMFRGFGTSTLMRPVDAALAGIDSLVLLDEAHLSRPLQNLVEPVTQCDLGDPSAVLPDSRSRPIFVSLTATGDDPQRFGLDAEDERHPVINKRLKAAKHIRLVENISKAGLAKELAKQVSDILQTREPSTAVVFVNSPGTARIVFRELQKICSQRDKPLDADIVLVTGRMRDREAEKVRKQILDRSFGVPAGRDRQQMRERHLVVVSTQTLEVGADLDFDVLVTEVCGTRALVQRLGRLNRLGESGSGCGAIVMCSQEKSFGIYGEEPLETWKKLQDSASDGVLDLSPENASKVLGEPQDQPPRVGELLPAHLWEWAKTTNPPPGEAPPELFYDELTRFDLSLSVVWRAFIPRQKGVELQPAVTAEESVEIPVWEAREAFSRLGMVSRLSSDKVTLEHDVKISALRPGDIVVLPSSSGFYDEYGWAPDSGIPVMDISLFRPPGIPLTAQVFELLISPGEELQRVQELVGQIGEPPEPDEDLDRKSLTKDLIDSIRSAAHSELLTDEEWGDVLQRLGNGILYSANDSFGRLLLKPRESSSVLPELRSDAFDELSFTATSSVLSDHLDAVGRLAGETGRAIGLRDRLVKSIEMAGNFHDLGKLDQRLQTWFDPEGKAEAPLAKSKTSRERWERDRIASGWPKGGRHEELSKRMVDRYFKSRGQQDIDSDLVLHLILSHHGYGRPLLLGTKDSSASSLTGQVIDATISVSGDLSETDWEQPARFRRLCEKYGYWGLAVLEAIVRQSDHQISRVVVV